MNPDVPEIELRPYASEHLLALLDSAAAFHRSFGLRAAAGLRDFFCSGEVSPQWLEQLRAIKGTNPWTFGFAVLWPEVGEVIGNAGFKGPPDDGIAEVAYAIVPARQGKGYATAALDKLIAFAVADGRVHRLCAHTLPETNASTRVLAKNGFTKTGELTDPDDGLVWRWERNLMPGSKPSQPAIRVVLPFHLKNLARVEGEIALEVPAPVTVAAVLDAIEVKYPALRGTIRDHGTLKRRPFIRYFVCKEDWSLEAADKLLPEEITSGKEPILVVGAMAGG